MSAKGKRTEFGDFQTPAKLARSICQLLRRQGIRPSSVVEPTCGTGAFLRAAASAFPECPTLLGYEINPEHVRLASAVSRAVVSREDFFAKDWSTAMGRLAEPLLVIGNPPWVTNATVGSMGGSNLPTKSNFLRFSGFDAITGKSNFDISEWMLMCLLGCLSGRLATFAMLCKTAVARKVLRHAWGHDLDIARAAIYEIDAIGQFGAAVDACLLVCVLEPGACSKECQTYATLASVEPKSTFALRQDTLVADLDAHQAYGHLRGECPVKWRSGIKHDCARVMELRPVGGGFYVNGLGEVNELEADFLFPMLKSSELANGREPSRCMLVPQRATGEDTSKIADRAPLTWRYLEAHAARLDARSSSVYRKRPRFSIFGIGEYSFAPWKVSISGFYKRLHFRCVAPFSGKCVVLDDTCYFLPCDSEDEANHLTSALNSEKATGYLNSLVFWDAKRPITAGLLSSLDIRLLDY